MKVFKVNDYEWIAANTAEEAVAWAMANIDNDADMYDPVETIHEADLDKEGAWVEVLIDELEQAISEGRKTKQVMGGSYVWKSFRELIDGMTTPQSVASTEW